jgi:hypothetical protein
LLSVELETRGPTYRVLTIPSSPDREGFHEIAHIKTLTLRNHTHLTIRLARLVRQLPPVITHLHTHITRYQIKIPHTKMLFLPLETTHV